MSDPGPSALDRVRAQLARRPHWMNGLMLFCAFMTFLYMPWDLFIKPVEVDQEVWFGVLFTGWAAKITAVPHWLVYGAGAFGFWKMRSWMWPWAAVYCAQVAFGMALWTWTSFDGMQGVIGALVSAAPFGILTWMLWSARERFGNAEN